MRFYSFITPFTNLAFTGVNINGASINV